MHLNVYVCEGQTGTGKSVLIFLAGLSVSLQSVINLLRWSLFQKLSYTWGKKKKFVAFINSQMDKNIQKHHSSHTEEGQSLYSNKSHCSYSLDVLLPSFCWSSSCSLGKSTSKVTMSDPRILLLSKFGRPSPFFQIRAPGLVILSLSMCTYKTKRRVSVSLWRVLYRPNFTFINFTFQHNLESKENRKKSQSVESKIW